MSFAGREMCILQVFGVEGGNHGATTDTIERLKRAAGKLGMKSARIYQHGGSQAYARSEVLSLAYLCTSFTDYVWLDSDAWLEGDVREHCLVLEQVLSAADECRQPVALPYVNRVGPANNDFSYALSFPEGRPRPLTLPCGVRVARLQGTGFGFVHMARSHVARMWAHWSADEAIRFRSYHTQLRGRDSLFLFRETVARKAYDSDEPETRPPRALPEDDSYWERARAIDEHAHLLVDLNLTHRGMLGDFAGSFGLAEARGVRTTGPGR